ncbi:MAG: SDR family NAD(P)-dependent oxidoreductase [Lacunisphaera sp.]|nr:SDR family NAD(P)-dependent oxidoreductase [Lacunisphaera sp.]
MSPGALSARYRTALVTGASTGLGRAFAEMLLAEGVEVWGTARETARLPVRDKFHPVALELADGAAAEKIFLEAARAAGGFDLVVNNAGYGVFGSFAETDFSVWQKQIELMLVNTARLSHAALRGMLARRRGALVSISSLAAEFPLPYQAAYNVVKSGLSALNESLMLETEGTGVIIIDFRPGDYRTDFEGSVQRPAPVGESLLATDPAQKARLDRVWSAFGRLMASGPAPVHAAESLRRALLRGRSGTVRTGRFFQAVLSPLLARLGSLSLRRRILAKYFGL